MLAVVVVVLIVGRVSGVVVKWGQSKEEVFLSLNLGAWGCPLRYDITRDTIGIGCEGESEYRVQYALREDVVPFRSACKAVRDGSSCVLRKVQGDHLWDQLATTPITELKPDWSRWPDEPLVEEEEKPDPFDEIAKIESLAEIEEPVFAVMTMHWCRRCDYYAELVVAASRRFRFARLDVLEHRDLARRVGVECSYKCRLLALPFEKWVPMPESSKDVDKLEKYVLPAWTSGDCESPPCVVFGSGNETAFEEAAEALRMSDIGFFFKSNATGIEARSADGFTYDCSKASNVTKCAVVGSASVLPLKKPDLDDEVWLRAVGVFPQLQVIVPEASHPLAAIGAEAATALRGSCSARLRVNESFAYLDFGVLDRSAAFVGIIADTSVAFDSPRFRWWSPSSVVASAREIVEWALEVVQYQPASFRAYRTAEPQDENEVVSATIDRALAQDTLVYVHNAWEQDARAVKAEFLPEVRALLAPLPCLTYAVGANESPVFDDEEEEEGFWLLPGKHRAKKWPKTPAALAKWVADKLDENHASKSEILARVREAIEAARAAKREEAALDLRAAEAPLEIVADGVGKRVYVAGEGPALENGDVVSVHYVGKTERGKVFDSSRRKKQPFDLVLGNGQVIACWDLALATMRVGDRARIDCEASTAYGPGSDRLAGGDLVFDVEILERKQHSGGEEEL
ncbi:hypothetical protein CTAYLR_006383 [Chrysophaeum taylorii]|uniref:peptidylprolyl isomerase n=1 Tax=Chrysophaeum taylorii TaxID=2483200 RepID=A0AAD7U8D5_9STRA|nr:hypothetical protein CTAYLR_006383 [Chrysophaeum taylorii]